MHYKPGSFTESYWWCASEGCLKSQAEVKAGEKQKYRRKTLRKRRKGVEEKAVEAEGQTYEPGAFWHSPVHVSDICVFEAQTLCFLEERGSLRAR